MLEVIVLIAVISIMVKIVKMGSGDSTKWGILTLLVCLFSSAIPFIGAIPIIRVIVGGVLAYTLYAVATMVSGSRA